MKLALAILACALIGAAAATARHGVHYGKAAARPGTPCALACEADPSADACASCCRTVRHEVDWGCSTSDTLARKLGAGKGGADEANCCVGEWDASCWDVGSDANKGHACNQCSPASCPQANCLAKWACWTTSAGGENVWKPAGGDCCFNGHPSTAPQSWLDVGLTDKGPCPLGHHITTDQEKAELGLKCVGEASDSGCYGTVDFYDDGKVGACCTPDPPTHSPTTSPSFSPTHSPTHAPSFSPTTSAPPTDDDWPWWWVLVGVLGGFVMGWEAKNRKNNNNSKVVVDGGDKA